MVFKLAEAAQNSWRRLKGHNQLPKLITGVKFTDGIETIPPPASTPSTIKAPVGTPCLATSFNAATAASFNSPIDSNFSQTALTLTTQDTAYENPCRRGPRARQNLVG